jgi:hypothetical protein
MKVLRAELIFLMPCDIVHFCNLMSVYLTFIFLYVLYKGNCRLNKSQQSYQVEITGSLTGNLT